MIILTIPCITRILIVLVCRTYKRKDLFKILEKVCWTIHYLCVHKIFMALSARFFRQHIYDKHFFVIPT